MPTPVKRCSHHPVTHSGTLCTYTTKGMSCVFESFPLYDCTITRGMCYASTLQLPHCAKAVSMLYKLLFFSSNFMSICIQDYLKDFNFARHIALIYICACFVCVCVVWCVCVCVCVCTCVLFSFELLRLHHRQGLETDHVHDN